MNDTITVGTVKSRRELSDGHTRLTVDVRGEDVTIYVYGDTPRDGHVIGVEEDEDGFWHINDPNPTPGEDSTVEAVKAYVKMYRVAAETRYAVLLRDRRGRRANVRYRIQPRWGCGSPADLPIGFVIDAAMDDVRCQAHAATGFYGTEQQEAATHVDALKGIALAYWYDRCHWHRVDLLTGAVTRDPDESKRRCKHTRITAQEWSRRYDAAIAANDGETLRYLGTNREKMLGKA